MEFLQSIWDFISGFLTVGNGLTGIGFILGMVAAKTGLDFINDVRDVVEQYKESKHPDSPGGEDVTDAEQEKINKEFAEAVESIWDKYKDTLFDLLGRVFRKLKFW